MFNLDKLDYGLDQSPTVMVGEKQQQQNQLGRNRGIPKASWALVDTNNNNTWLMLCFTLHTTFLIS